MKSYKSYTRYTDANLLDKFQGGGEAFPTSRVIHGTDDQEWSESGEIDGRPATMFFLIQNSTMDEINEMYDGDLSNLDWWVYVDGVEFTD